jgi:hypothetical protein
MNKRIYRWYHDGCYLTATLTKMVGSRNRLEWNLLLGYGEFFTQIPSKENTKIMKQKENEKEVSDPILIRAYGPNRRPSNLSPL